jgi:hypothetical protein
MSGAAFEKRPAKAGLFVFARRAMKQVAGYVSTECSRVRSLVYDLLVFSFQL